MKNYKLVHGMRNIVRIPAFGRIICALIIDLIRAFLHGTLGKGLWAVADQVGTKKMLDRWSLECRLQRRCVGHVPPWTRRLPRSWAAETSTQRGDVCADLRGQSIKLIAFFILFKCVNFFEFGIFFVNSWTFSRIREPFSKKSWTFSDFCELFPSYEIFQVLIFFSNLRTYFQITWTFFKLTIFFLPRDAQIYFSWRHRFASARSTAVPLRLEKNVSFFFHGKAQIYFSWGHWFALGKGNTSGEKNPCFWHGFVPLVFSWKKKLIETY
jgi:hypothetical protein